MAMDEMAELMKKHQTGIESGDRQTGPESRDGVSAEIPGERPAGSSSSKH